jgi:hypothetical protein
MPRAAKSQATESATMNNTVETIRTPSATSKTGRRPTSSETRPARSRAASAPQAKVAKIKVSVRGEKCQSAL